MSEQFKEILEAFDEWVVQYDVLVMNENEELEREQAECVLALFEKILRTSTLNPSIAINIINAANTLESSLIGAHGGTSVANQSDVFVNMLLNTCLRMRLLTEIFRDVASMAIKECEGTKDIPVQSLRVPEHPYYEPEILRKTSAEFCNQLLQQTRHKLVKHEIPDVAANVQTAKMEAIEAIYMVQSTCEENLKQLNDTVALLRGYN